jgi:hypothetical protein
VSVIASLILTLQSGSWSSTISTYLTIAPHLSQRIFFAIVSSIVTFFSPVEPRLMDLSRPSEIIEAVA